MPVEKSGQNEFDFQYGDEFGAHIEKFDPDFSKVLVRYNPDDPDTEMNQRQLGRLKELADWLHEHDRKFLFELLVPATDEQLAKVDGDADRYDAELRPELMRAAIQDVQKFGIEVDIWKIEGVDAREDAVMLAEQARSGPGPRGRQLRAAGPRCLHREGRAVARGGGHRRWLHRLRDRPLDLVGRAQGLPADELDREAAATQIAENYLHFVRRLRGPAGRTESDPAAGRERAHVPRTAAIGRLGPRWR